LSCRSFFYMVHIDPLSDIWFTNIFSHSAVYHFTSLSPLQKHFGFVVHFSIFFFCCPCSKSLQDQCHEDFPILSPRIFKYILHS
jgi:hypothetical protein